MEPASSSDKVSICPVCGDEGFTNAFVFCIKCLDHPIHRYCLRVMPKTFDEPVIWVCEPCKQTVPNPVTLPKAKSLQSQKEEAPISRDVKTIHPKKKLKKKRRVASLITGTEVFVCREKISVNEEGVTPKPKHVHSIPKKKRTKRKMKAASVCAKEKECSPQNTLKNETQKACTTITGAIEHSWSDTSPTSTNSKNKKGVVCSLEEQKDDNKPSRSPGEHEKLISDSSTMKNKSRMTTNVSQSADFKNNPQNIDYPHALPFEDHVVPFEVPIWRGSFNIRNTNYDLFEGFFAHLSNKAVEKVYEEATTMPSLLSLEMHTKTFLWPKSFQECERPELNIALYFFPGDPISVVAFDQLVSDMMDDEGLAMRVITANAELLIFTSIVLPKRFWRFKGKYYLWGVFRRKQNDSTPPVHYNLNSNKFHLSKDSPNKAMGVKKTLMRVKTLDARSPQSPLSNNGENGVDMDRESGD